MVPMSAYWISIYREITDEAKVAAYAELAGPALRAAGGTFVARGLPEQTYEGGEATRTVLIEFDSVDATLPSIPQFSTIWRRGSSSERRTICTPVASSLFRV